MFPSFNKPIHLAFALLVLSCIGCGLSYDPHDDIYTGKAAKSHLSLCDQSQLPATMNDLWVFDGGTFGGTIYYVSFQCDTLDDCRKAVEAFGAPDQSEFKEGIQTRFAVNQQGPSFYFNKLKHPQWNLADIKNGTSYEWHQGNRSMDFWAIDRDRLRVYYHQESGGFPASPPSKDQSP